MRNLSRRFKHVMNASLGSSNHVLRKRNFLAATSLPTKASSPVACSTALAFAMNFCSSLRLRSSSKMCCLMTASGPGRPLPLLLLLFIFSPAARNPPPINTRANSRSDAESDRHCATRRTKSEELAQFLQFAYARIPSK